jgi:hypothetical protein
MRKLFLSLAVLAVFGFLGVTAAMAGCPTPTPSCQQTCQQTCQTTCQQTCQTTCQTSCQKPPSCQQGCGQQSNCQRGKQSPWWMDVIGGKSRYKK